MSRVIFWGATGQAKVLREALPPEWELVALFDNREIPSPLIGVPIFQGERGLFEWESDSAHQSQIYACVAIGGNRGRDRFERQQWLAIRGYRPLTVIHTRAFIAATARLGEGCQVLAHSAVGVDSQLGHAVIVNTGASVDHDCVLGDGVHVAPGAVLAGEVVVDNFAFIGTGAVILPRLHIGEGAIVGAGAVVTKNVAAGDTVTGNPARAH